MVDEQELAKEKEEHHARFCRQYGRNGDGSIHRPFGREMVRTHEARYAEKGRLKNLPYAEREKIGCGCDSSGA